MGSTVDKSLLNRLSVRQIALGVMKRTFSGPEVASACLARIRERDSIVKAWVDLNDEAIDRQLALADRLGGPLAGVPFGVKDVLDAAGFKTEMGSRLYEGHAAKYDAGCVGQLRLLGGVVLGKTTTCEFAGTQPTPTTNPHDPARTPGGSSSGSAAAVADFMVPLALGTQTGGSVLRPAAFCGVVGYKPTYGLYAVSGMKEAAHSFDTPGIFARTVDDISMVHSLLMNDAEPAVTRLHRIGLPEGNVWESIEPSVAEAIQGVMVDLGRAGVQVVNFKFPFDLVQFAECRAVVNAFERSRDLAGEWLLDRKAMGPLTYGIVERGFRITGSDYVAARRDIEAFRLSMSTSFKDFDVMALPVTPGIAPLGLDNTGDPRLQEAWTALHMASMAIPIGTTIEGMPIGMQLVAASYRDCNLISAARWIEAELGR